MVATEPHSLGARLAHARGIRKISQSGLARELGLSRGAVGQWETGKTKPAQDNLAKAAVTLGVQQEWLATGRGERDFPTAPDLERNGHIVRVPLLSWVSAGDLVDAESQIPIEDVPLLAFADLGRGDFFALKVVGDSMDRVSPDGSIIVINKDDRELITGKCYVFSMRGETTFKRWQEDDPPYLDPYSTNPLHKPKLIKKRAGLGIVGRVRRTVLDL